MREFFLVSILFLVLSISSVNAQTTEPTATPTVVPTASPTLTPTPSPVATTTPSPTSSATAVVTSTPAMSATPTVAGTVKPTVRATTLPSASLTVVSNESPAPEPTRTANPTFLPIEIGSSGGANGSSTAVGEATVAGTVTSLLTHVIVLVVGLSLATAGYLLSGKRIGFIEKYVGRFRKNAPSSAVPAQARVVRTSTDLVRPMKSRQPSE